MTDCNRNSRALSSPGLQSVAADTPGDRLTSDAGALLLLPCPGLAPGRRSPRGAQLTDPLHVPGPPIPWMKNRAGCFSKPRGRVTIVRSRPTRVGTEPQVTARAVIRRTVPVGPMASRNGPCPHLAAGGERR